MRCAIKLGALIALAVLLLPSAVSAQANPYGDWKAVFVGPLETRPKPFAGVTLSIQPAPGGVEIIAQAGHWPGQLDISDVTLHGDRLTFFGTGRKGWGSGSGGVMTYYCCPEMSFDAIIQGDEMTLTLTQGTLESPMKAFRLSEPPSLYVFTAVAGTIRRSDPVGALEGPNARATFTAVTMQSPFYERPLFGVVRITFDHKGAAPATSLFIAQTDIDALRRALPTTSNRSVRSQDIEDCGSIENSANGLIMCGHQLKATADDLDALLARAEKILDSSALR